MANISSIKAASLSMCFSVGAVLFSSHAGGGFATGNQENVYFVSLGWLGPITAIITMLLFTLTIKEAMNMYNSRHLTSYRQLFQNLYSPFKGIEYLFEAFFYIMVLMAVSATISGAASAINAQTGLNYYAGIGIVGTIIFFLTIFGAGLVRRATTYMGMAILAMVIMIFSVGIYMGGSIEGTQFFTAAMAQDFATNGFSKVPTAILHAFTYSGFQCVVIPTMIVVGTPLVTRKNCATSMWFSFAMNAIALTLAVCMLLGWTGIYGKSPLPTDQLQSHGHVLADHCLQRLLTAVPHLDRCHDGLRFYGPLLGNEMPEENQPQHRYPLGYRHLIHHHRFHDRLRRRPDQHHQIRLRLLRLLSHRHHHRSLPDHRPLQKQTLCR